MEPQSKKNLIIMAILMTIMIVGSIIFGKMINVDRVIERTDKVTVEETRQKLNNDLDRYEGEK